jgi:hypothetical protein
VNALIESINGLSGYSAAKVTRNRDGEVILKGVGKTGIRQRLMHMRRGNATTNWAVADTLVDKWQTPSSISNKRARKRI